MTRVDLDELGNSSRLYATPEQLQSLVAELRAAREAIRRMRGLEIVYWTPEAEAAIVAYDKAVG